MKTISIILASLIISFSYLSINRIEHTQMPGGELVYLAKDNWTGKQCVFDPAAQVKLYSTDKFNIPMCSVKPDGSITFPDNN